MGVGNAAAVDAFGSGLHKDAGHGLHHSRIKALGSRHHEGMLAHGLDDALARRRFGEPGKAQGHVAQGKGPGGNRAAIDAAGERFHVNLAVAGDSLGDGELNRVFHLHIILGIGAELACQSQHAGVFSGTVVVDLQRLAAGPHFIVLGFHVGGPMGAAFVEFFIVLCLLQHGTGDAHVLRFAIVGGAGQGNFFVGETKVINRAGFDHGHELKRLDGRTRKNGHREITGGLDQLSLPVHHGEGPRMAAFNNATTGDFGNNRIGQGVSSFKLAMGAKRYQNKARNSKAKSRPKAQM